MTTGSLSAQTFSYDFDTANTLNPFGDTGWDAGWNTNEQAISGGDARWNQAQGHGIFTSFGEESVAGVIVGLAGNNFQATGVHAGSSYDLSTIGSSLTITQFWGPTTFQTGVSGTPNGINELMQIGLISNTSATFRDASNHSLYVGGLEQSYDKNANTRNISHSVIDETGASTIAIASTALASTDSLYEYAITFTNSGANVFDIKIGVDHWSSTGSGFPYTLQTANIISSSLNNVSHNFTKSELSDLHVGLGLRITDSTQISGSGTNYDASKTDFNAVPEPSSTALLGLGTLGLLVRRKR